MVSNLCVLLKLKKEEKTHKLLTEYHNGRCISATLYNTFQNHGGLGPTGLPNDPFMLHGIGPGDPLTSKAVNITVILWWICFDTYAITPFEKYKSPMQINEIHQLNGYHQTHSSKAIFNNIRGIGDPTLSTLHHSDCSMLQHQSTLVWVGEWLSLTAFLGKVDSEVHIVHICCVITAYKLESLSSLT